MQLPTLLTALLAASVASGSAAGEHPIAKVVKLLQDLKAQVKSEGQAEEVSYGKFTYWCQTSSAELNAAITEEKETIDTLQSTIDGKTKEVSLTKDAIGKLEDEIKDLQASDKTATEDDKARNKVYLEAEADFKSTITAIGECITALEGAKTATDSKLLLAQSRVRDIFGFVAAVTTEGEQKSLMAFMDAPGSSAIAMVQNASAPNPGDLKKHTKKYSFKSNSVTELLKNLKLKFEDELLEATKAETNAANAFGLAKNARDATLKATEASKKQKETDLADAEGALSTAQGDLKDEKADLKADAGALDATKDNCNTKKAEWEERSLIRKNELAAMTAGIEILAKVSGVRTGAPKNPVPPSAPVSMMQALQASKLQTEPQKRAVQLLRSTAKTYHSRALERLAMQLDTHVPKQFQDVINSIQKMIFRLKQEQTDEDNHKAWCDLEMAKTSASLSDKNDKIKELNAKIKEDNAKVLTLTSDIQAAVKMISDVKKFQEEATEIRETGKQENVLAIKDAVAAQKAITNAIAVLTDFYKSTGSIKKESWELLQEPVKLPKDPSTWDSGYSGVADPKKADEGVVAVLEAVSADFSEMEGNTRAQEVADQKEYDDTMKKHSIELARRTKENEMKSAQKKRLVDDITSKTAQKKHVSDEVESTEQYEKDLKPACVDGDSTYTDRKAARDAEIKALGQAQVILDKTFDAMPTTAPKTDAFMQRIAPHA